MATPLELPQLEGLFQRHAPQLFGLCYLHAGNTRQANALLRILLCDLAFSPRRGQRASASLPGLFRCAHEVCLEQSYKKPRRQKKKPAGEDALPPPVLPFTMTDALRALLKLSPKYKSPLYLRLALGWTAQDAAAATGSSPARVDKLVSRGLKKAKLTEERAAQALSSIAPYEHGPQAVWDAFLVDRAEKGFAGKDRLRRFKRALDNAIPYIALGVVALSVFAYYGVEYGWFGGEPYTPTPAESYAESAPVYSTGALTVFSPQEGSPDQYDLVQYNVTDAPLSFEALVRQMVALGGAPAGTTLFSVESTGSGGETSDSLAIDPAASALTVELSQDAADWFAAASPQEQEQMLLAMACTFSAACPDLEELHLRSAGRELAAADGSSAQDLLSAELAPVRAVDTPYHE